MTVGKKIRRRILWSGQAVARKLPLVLSRSAKRLDALVVSSGGTASTNLIRHIGKFASVNCPGDTDRLKHLPRPVEGQKILFIHRDPNDAADSVLRRSPDFLRHHGAKLGSLGAQVLPLRLARKRVVVALVRQRRAFLDAAKKEPRRIVHMAFDEFFERPKEISEFLGIPDQSFIDEFPVRVLDSKKLDGHETGV